MEVSRPSYSTADEAHILCDMGEEAWGKSGRKIHLYLQKSTTQNASNKLGTQKPKLLKKRRLLLTKIGFCP